MAVLTVDRPQAMNAIALATMDEFDAALDDLSAGEQRVVVLTGAGDRAFIAGGDVKQLEAVRDEQFALTMAARFRESLDRLSSLAVPVVCALNGVALGGGAEVAVACDFRIASETARIGFIQVRLAVMPGSFCRNEPAQALRGLANSRSPLSAWSLFSRSNSGSGM